MLGLAWDKDARGAAGTRAARRARRLVWRWQRGGLADYACARGGNFRPRTGTGPRRADGRRLRAAGLEIVISSGAEWAGQEAKWLLLLLLLLVWGELFLVMALEILLCLVTEEVCAAIGMVERRGCGGSCEGISGEGWAVMGKGKGGVVWLIDSKDIVGFWIVLGCRCIRGRGSVFRGRSGRLGRVAGNGSGR